jgi:hypothetical protein
MGCVIYLKAKDAVVVGFEQLKACFLDRQFFLKENKELILS